MDLFGKDSEEEVLVKTPEHSYSHLFHVLSTVPTTLKTSSKNQYV